MNKKIAILGAGPVGLGAGYKLAELGYKNWTIYEKSSHVGGHSTSWKDENGFWWDEGGHVIFSHYQYFTEAVDKVLKGKYNTIERKAWVRMLNCWVPYPFQNNIRYLPKEVLWECIEGILEIEKDATSKGFKNFQHMNETVMGKGITKHFMAPYNFQVWAHPLEEMDYKWIGERVPIIDPARVLKNIILEEDDVNWGPNNVFTFPKVGGTGAIYNGFLPYVKDHVEFKKEVVKIDTSKNELYFADGATEKYDYLINSLPLDQFTLISDLPGFVKEAASELEHSSGFIVGIGIKGKTPKELADKCWIYFPESSSPFNRITVFSNYSKKNAPSGTYSLMAEIPYSKHKAVNKETIVEETIQGLVNTGLITTEEEIVDRYKQEVEYFYPIPTLKRDGLLDKIQPELMKRGIYSRGRFGAWRYEISNMDHCFMQGVEVADMLVTGREEVTWTNKIKVS